MKAKKKLADAVQAMQRIREEARRIAEEERLKREKQQTPA